MPRISPSRLARVQELLASGTPTTTVVETCISEFQIGRRQAWRYVQKIYERWANENATACAARRHQRAKFLERIAHDAYKDHQYSAAVSALRQLCRIEGLERVDINLKQDIALHGEINVLAMTSSDRRRKISELMAPAQESKYHGQRGHNVGQLR